MDASEIKVELARLQERLIRQEESGSMFRKIAYSISAVALSLVSGMAGQMLVYGGRQDVQLNIIQEHNERMIQMVTNMQRAEDRHQADIAEMRTDLKGLIANTAMARR